MTEIFVRKTERKYIYNDSLWSIFNLTRNVRNFLINPKSMWIPRETNVIRIITCVLFKYIFHEFLKETEWGCVCLQNLWLEFKKSVWTSKIYVSFFFQMLKVRSFLSVAPNIRNELFIKPNRLIFHAINDFAFNSLNYYILQGNLLKHS